MLKSYTVPPRKLCSVCSRSGHKLLLLAGGAGAERRALCCAQDGPRKLQAADIIPSAACS